MNLTSIPSLRNSISPTAILGLVIAIVIDSVQTSIRWSQTHIFQKHAKVISPFRTNRNPPTPIAIPFVMVGIRAALNHLRPAFVFACSFLSKVMAMLKVVFFLHTTAAFCGLRRIFPHHKFGTNNFFSATIASAQPQSSPRIIYSFNSRESVELLTRNIFESEVIFAHFRMIA